MSTATKSTDDTHHHGQAEGGSGRLPRRSDPDRDHFRGDRGRYRKHADRHRRHSSSSNGCQTTTSRWKRIPTTSSPGEPGLATLRFNILPEPQVAITNLKSGDVQGVLNIPVSQVAAARRRRQRHGAQRADQQHSHLRDARQEQRDDSHQRQGAPGAGDVPRQERGPADGLCRQRVSEMDLRRIDELGV